MKDRLIALGLSSGEAERKARLFVETDRAVATGPRLRWFVPGRIEVVGKHTDYAGGRSLVCTVERGFCVTAVPRVDSMLRIVDVENRAEATFHVSADQPAASGWRTYPATVARNFPPSSSSSTALRGADLAIASDLAPAAGLSSSTAMIIAVFTVLAEINALDRHPDYRQNIPTLDALASYLGCVENGRTFGTLSGDSGVGTLGGSQDHAAILRSESGSLVCYAYSPPGLERVVPLPPGLAFVVGSSGIAAEKTGAARDRYNRAARAVTAILDLWRAESERRGQRSHGAHTLFDIVAHDEAARAELRRLLERTSHAVFNREELIARFDQFVLEALDIVPRSTSAIATRDLVEFGRIVDASHAAAARWLGNQIPETIALADLARKKGALAASSFGAGFGGSVWALVHADQATTFLTSWQRDYVARFPAQAERAVFFTTAPGPPCVRL
jgi:galactokinase